MPLYFAGWVSVMQYQDIQLQQHNIHAGVWTTLKKIRIVIVVLSLITLIKSAVLENCWKHRATINGI